MFLMRDFLMLSGLVRVKLIRFSWSIAVGFFFYNIVELEANPDSVVEMISVQKRVKDVEMEKKIDKLLKKMTLEEKVSLWHGCSSFEVGGIKRLGIPKIRMTDGPQGVRGPVSTYFPTGIAMASSWNEKLMQEIGSALGDETRKAGCNVLLGPGVNIMRTPLGGRNFEYFGEDPFLAGKSAAAYIRGIQSRNISPCVKHFVANNQEWCRTSGSSEVDERSLREIYLKAFKIACDEGGSWALMSSYNKVNGVFASANRHLQQDILKNEWNWDGVVVSDWGGAHDWKGCALGGLDLIMPGPKKSFAKKLIAAVRKGEISENIIDEHARRVLRLIFRTQPEEENLYDVHKIRKTARTLAGESVVLLKNDGLLPLDINKIKTLAVIGPNADKQHSMSGVAGSGGSGAVNPPYETTPLQGLKNFTAGKVKINYAPSYYFPNETEKIPSAVFQSEGKPGLVGNYFNNPDFKGEAFLTQRESVIDFSRNSQVAGVGAVPANNFSVCWNGELIPPETGVYTLIITGNGCSKLFIDGKSLIEIDKTQKVKWKSRKISLEKGKSYKIKLEYAFENSGRAVFKLKWKRPNLKPDFESAVKAASESDAVVVFAGINHTYDREALGWGLVPGSDRPDLEMIGPQAELINAVAEANPKTIVVLIGGGPLSVEKFYKNVKSILMAWYPGQDGGDVIAEILFGKLNPSGKLCCTWGKKLEDWAVHRDESTYPGKKDGPVEYREGIFVGYRQFDRDNIAPRYPFGFGLSYTTFDVGVPLVKYRDGRYIITCPVTNTGKRSGAEVLQLYVGDLKPDVPRPPKELKGFVKISLNPGETKNAEFILSKDDFSYFDPAGSSWKFRPGKYRFYLGVSSRDIRRTVDVDADFNDDVQ
jgi:beta-glucosidase